MLPILQNQSVLTMSSREIADLVDTTHDSVLKTIRDYKSRGVVSGNETTYTHSQNKQTYPEFILNKRDTLLIASGYSVELRARIIDRLEELEARKQFQIPQTLPEALRLAADLADQLEQAKPKLAVYDLLADRKGDVSTTLVAKELGTTAFKLNKFLRDNGVKWLNADLPKAGYETWFNCIADVKNGHEFTQCLISPKGQIEIAKLWSKI